MIKKIIIRNKSARELGVMVEPWTGEESVGSGGMIVLEADFEETEIVIDVGDDVFLSIWGPHEYKMTALEDGDA
jgi:hypothetical protein